MRAVALLPCAAILTGACLGVHVLPPAHAARVVLPALWMTAAALWWCTPRVSVVRQPPPTAVVALLVAGFLLASWLLAARARDAALHAPIRAAVAVDAGAPVTVRFVLREDASVTPFGVSLRVRVVAVRSGGRWRDVDGGVSVSVGGQSSANRVATWRAGRTLVAPLLWRRPPYYLDDGVPDFERDLALSGTALFASVKSALLVDVVSRGTWVEERAADARAIVRRSVGRWVGSRDPVAGAIVTAVLIGDRTGLPDAIRDRLQAAGTYHVIAISGGNIAVLGTAILIALMVVLVRGRVAALCTIVMLIAYAGIVTAGPSVWRATMMAVAYLVARVLDHRSPAWQTTATAASAMVVWQPLDVGDVGFLLTFGATAALIEVANLHAARPTHATTRWPTVCRWLTASLVASVATEVALMPVSAVVFSRLTMAGPLLNLVAVPVMAIVQVAGMVVVLTDAAASIARPTGWLAYAGAMALTESARLIDIARWLTLRVPPPSPWLVVGYYTGLLLAVCGRGGRRRWCGGAMVVVAGGAMVLGVGLSGNRPPPGLLRWTVFDVGQGDSTLLQWRDRDLLVDAGGAPYGAGFDIGGRVLAPALWARGVRTLTTLGITHGDPDHLGGAAAVVDVFAPASLWLGLPVPLHQPTQELIARAAAARIDLAERRAGEDLEWGGVRLRVLNPPAPDWERRRVRNDDSIVIEVHYGDVAILLTGDISAAVERAIAPQLTAAPIRILKVAHHGSRTSTSRELLEAWRPQIAVISCGRGNTFGHPAPEVVDRLAAMGARIYRTDRDGEVTVDTDGRRVSVRTFVGGAQ